MEDEVIISKSIGACITNKKEKRCAILSFILTLLDIIQSC